MAVLCHASACPAVACKKYYYNLPLRSKDLCSTPEEIVWKCPDSSLTFFESVNKIKTSSKLSGKFYQ